MGYIKQTLVVETTHVNIRSWETTDLQLLPVPASLTSLRQSKTELPPSEQTRLVFTFILRKNTTHFFHT